MNDIKPSNLEKISYNENIAIKLINKYSIKPTDKVLIIGEISCEILEYLLVNFKIVTVYDKEFKKINTADFKLKNFYKFRNKLRIIREDFFNNNLDTFDFCFINLKPSILIPFILKLKDYKFKVLFLLAQKDFADKLKSQPGEKAYCKYSIITQLLYRISRIIKVPKTVFPFKNDFCYIDISLKTNSLDLNINEFYRFISLCFNRRNKTLGSNLLSQINLIKNFKDNITDKNKKLLIQHTIKTNKFDQIRPSKMFVEDFLRILIAFKKEGISF